MKEDLSVIRPYLIFKLDSHIYGLDSLAVEEIFFLPELTPIPEAPRDLVGVANLRGDLLPVMDLNRRFGYQNAEYALSDSVVVVKLEQARVGLIVNQVIEVQNIDSADIIKELSHGRNGAEIEENKFIFTEGIGKSPDNIILILNAENLLKYVQRQELTPEEANNEADYKSSPVFCPHATIQEMAIFKQRARELRQKNETEDLTSLKPLAVFALNNEFFAIDLTLIKEFCDLPYITPIPCCPGHIVGNMNLRGEILTIIDIKGLLNLSLQSLTKQTKGIVIEVEDFVVGIAVDKVCDVMFLNPREITAIPEAIAPVNDEYLLGAAAYQQKMMTILDICKILKKGDLVVEEV